MTDGEFRKLLKPDRYQVFLLSCPASIPVAFASHNWFVLNEKGKVSRWEVGFGLHRGRQKSWGHLDLDILPPTKGVQMIAFLNTFWWDSKLRASIEGGEYSLASRMAAFIARSPRTYPFQKEYKLLAPNSNTYAQWVLDHFPEAGMRLPWNAVGKKFGKGLQDIHHLARQV